MNTKKEKKREREGAGGGGGGGEREKKLKRTGETNKLICAHVTATNCSMSPIN